jgi:hypothetical protein
MLTQLLRISFPSKARNKRYPLSAPFLRTAFGTFEIFKLECEMASAVLTPSKIVNLGGQRKNEWLRGLQYHKKYHSDVLLQTISPIKWLINIEKPG